MAPGSGTPNGTAESVWYNDAREVEAERFPFEIHAFDLELDDRFAEYRRQVEVAIACGGRGLSHADLLKTSGRGTSPDSRFFRSQHGTSR